MSSTTQNNAILIRNYIIAATSVMLMSVGLADLFNYSALVSRQNRLDRSNHFAVKLLSQTQNFGR